METRIKNIVQVGYGHQKLTPLTMNKSLCTLQM